MKNVLVSLLIGLGLGACGGDDGASATSDAAVDAIPMDGAPVTRFDFIANRLHLPTTSPEALAFGLDIDSNRPDGDGAVDNQLGAVLAAFAGQGFPIQADADRAVADGSVLMLVELTGPSLRDAASLTFGVLQGANPTPAPCTNPANPTTCGQHLLDGSFTVSASSASTTLVGNTVGGDLTAGPGRLTLRVPLIGGIVTLPLIGARVEATVGSSIPGGTIAGAITTSDMDTLVLPAIAANLTSAIRDADLATPCAGNGSTTCTCPGNAPNAIKIAASLDRSGDCVVTATDIKTSAFGGLLAADVIIDGFEATSFGLGFEANPATITGR